MKTPFTAEEIAAGAAAGGAACLEKHGVDFYKALGRASAAGRGRKMTRQAVQQAYDMRRAGEVWRVIAEALKVSVRTIRRELADHG